MMKLVHIKFSNFIWICHQLAIHFAGLVRTNFNEQTKNANIAKFMHIRSLNIGYALKNRVLQNLQTCTSRFAAPEKSEDTTTGPEGL